MKTQPKNSKNPPLDLVQSSDRSNNSETSMFSVYNDKIRPLLDVVDKLRQLKVTTEGIQLPTIVVVGDQSSGKSSVLESLAGINLPRGQGICTRVPLIMRLQHHHAPRPHLFLEFNGKRVDSDEAHISDAINTATTEIAGNAKGISNTPLTLVVKKRGAPDLTMVDLPGITRVPVHGQPDDIYEQISAIIMDYIKPEESIILNVLSATVDFPTCESIRMSQQIDKSGKRTLAVVTKVDKAPEGLLEKVTADDVNIGLGYVCVRNRVGSESYEEARLEEEKLFKSHPLLSKIDSSITGVPVLSGKLVEIQGTSIARRLPIIAKQIKNKLNDHVTELNKLPQTISSPSEAYVKLLSVIGSTKETLKNILLRGDYDEFPDETNMHCTARLVERLNAFDNQLQESFRRPHIELFLVDEIKVLEETRGIDLPNFLPSTAFHALLNKKISGICKMPVDFVSSIWDYIEIVVTKVLMLHSQNYSNLQFSLKRSCINFILKMKEKSVERANEIVEMERLTVYTCNPEYSTVWKELMNKQVDFVNEVLKDDVPVVDKALTLPGFGELKVGHLRQHSQVLHEAFDLKMRITAYWVIVLRRLVDSMALHLQISLKNLISSNFDSEIISDIMNPQNIGVERLLGDSPSISGKREKLKKSIKLLSDSEELVAKVVDNNENFYF